jgi:putative spermidine/putrescine transport system ATP-binding protein
LREQIRALQQRLSITTVFVTHDQEEALSVSDRVAVMNGGRLEQVARPATLYDEPETPFVAEFVGTMNRLPATLHPGSKVSVLGRELGARGPLAGRGSGDVHAMARPEALSLAAVQGGNGIVTAIAFRGAQSRVDVLLWADVSVKVDVPSALAASMQVGSSVEVSMAVDSVLVDEVKQTA